jgi:hypothetical protein
LNHFTVPVGNSAVSIQVPPAGVRRVGAARSPVVRLLR